MFLKPAKLGEKEIPESILSEDKKHCKKIGPCGIGKEALYLNLSLIHISEPTRH